MSIAELSTAYDLLLGILKQREVLIKDRLAETLKHYGKEEEILFESKDYRREQESIPDMLRKLYRDDKTEIDVILGINEQISHVNAIKHIPAAEKFYQWMTGSFDFEADKNFSENQLAFAETKEFNH